MNLRTIAMTGLTSSATVAVVALLRQSAPRLTEKHKVYLMGNEREEEIIRLSEKRFEGVVELGGKCVKILTY